MPLAADNLAKRRWRIALIVIACCAALVVAGYFALVAAFPPARLAALLGEQV